MEQETSDNSQSRKEKVYKEREIWVGAFLGGPLAVGYMVAENYRAFGESGKIRRTWAATLAATAFFIFVAFFAPYSERIPNSLFSLVCAGIIVLLAQIYQGERVRTHIRFGGKIQSWWKTIGVSLAGSAVTIILMLGISFAVAAVENYNLTSKFYGTKQHQVYFSKTNITESEVDQISEAAMQTNLFLESAGTWTAYIRKIGTDYEISIAVTKATFSDVDFLKFLKDERGYMQARFPNNKIIINLVGEDFNQVEKRIE